jgi:hypothetical protein
MSRSPMLFLSEDKKAGSKRSIAPLLRGMWWAHIYLGLELWPMLSRLFRYARLLVGHGWNTAAFWIATVYSIYSVVAPEEFQRRVLTRVHINPSQRLAVWGFGLAGFFLYAGFRAWGDEHWIADNLKSERDASASALSRHLSEGTAQTLQAEHSRALMQYTQELRSERTATRLRDSLVAATAKSPIGPEAVVAIQTGNEPCLLVANQGSAADFYGVFTASGMVSSKASTELFCRWAHTNAPRARIAKGRRVAYCWPSWLGRRRRSFRADGP